MSIDDNAMPGSLWIGRPLPRLEDEPLLRERARFIADLDAGDPLHVVLVRAPLPHARITGIDRTAASRLPGVVDVFVAGDLPAGANIRNERLPGVRPTTVALRGAKTPIRLLTCGNQSLRTLHHSGALRLCLGIGSGGSAGG